MRTCSIVAFAFVVGACGRSDLDVANSEGAYVGSPPDVQFDVAVDSAHDAPGCNDAWGFAPPETYATDAAMMFIGDFNGDGWLDLAGASAAHQTFGVRMNNGDGTFAPQVTQAFNVPNPWDVTVGDFNGDGLADLAISGFNDPIVWVALNVGDGTFPSQTSYTVGSSPWQIVSADFNGDHHLDVAVLNLDSNNLSILFNHGDGTFSAQVTYATPHDAFPIVPGDFNGDGNIDFVVGGSGDSPGLVETYFNRGDGTYAPPVTFNAGPSTYIATAGDFNGDGLTDLVVMSSNGDVASPANNTLFIFLGHGDGTFGLQASYNLGGGTLWESVVDINGDGLADVAIAHVNSDYVGVRVNDGGGVLAPPVTFASGNIPRIVATVDFNGDGYPDLAIDEDGNGGVGVYLSHCE